MTAATHTWRVRPRRATQNGLKMDRNTTGHGSENIPTLLAAGVTDAGAARVTPLTGGTYNTVVRVELADGRDWVIKIPPSVDLPALRYERGLLRGEMTFYEAAGAAGTPVPDVVRASLAPPSPELPHLIVTARPGAPWTEHDTAMEETEKRRLRQALGEYVARFHAVTGRVGTARTSLPKGEVTRVRRTGRHPAGVTGCSSPTV